VDEEKYRKDLVSWQQRKMTQALDRRTAAERQWVTVRSFILFIYHKLVHRVHEKRKKLKIKKIKVK